MNEDYSPELIEKIAKEVQEIKILADWQRKKEWWDRHWESESVHYSYKFNVWKAI